MRHFNMVNMPAFTKTKDDVGKEIVERKHQLSKLNFDYELLQAKVEEYKTWIESSFGGAEKFFKEVAEEVERDQELIEKKLNEKNAQVRVATDAVVNLKRQKEGFQQEVDSLRGSIDKVKKQLERHNEEVSQQIEMLDSRYEEVKVKVTELKSEENVLSKKVEKGTAEIDARREVLREWSDKLHQKEKDVRLWEVRVKRKVRDNFPGVGEIKV